MAASVIIQASRDANQGDKQAIKFLTKPSPVFTLWCDWLNLDPEELNKYFMKKYIVVPKSSIEDDFVDFGRAKTFAEQLIVQDKETYVVAEAIGECHLVLAPEWEFPSEA